MVCPLGCYFAIYPVTFFKRKMHGLILSLQIIAVYPAVLEPFEYLVIRLYWDDAGTGGNLHMGTQVQFDKHRPRHTNVGGM